MSGFALTGRTGWRITGQGKWANMSEAMTDIDPAPEHAQRVRRAAALVIGAVAVLVLTALAWAGWRVLAVSSAQRYELECATARTAQDWTRLERSALAWAERQPELARPLLYAAEAAEQQHALARAAEHLARVPDSDPQTPRALLELADLQFGTLNKPFAGEQTCQRVLRLDPAVGEAHRRLVFFYGMTLQRQQMVRQAREAIERKCDIPDTYVHILGADWITFSNAYELNGRWLQGDPDNELLLVARAIHYVGSQALDEGGEEEDAAGAKKAAAHHQMLSDLLVRFPHNAELLSYFLKKSRLSGNIERVTELLGQAPPEAREDNRFWRYKGWLHAARHEYELAEAAYRRALQLNPYDWHAQHELADLMRRLKRQDEVETLQALALEGKNLRKVILELPNVKDVPVPVLRRIAAYAEACGDNAVAGSLSWRIDEMRRGW